MFYTGVLQVSVLRGCLARVSYKTVLQKWHSCFKSAPSECSTRVYKTPHKCALLECLATLSSRIVAQECLCRASHMSVLQERRQRVLVRVLCNKSLQECLTRVWSESVFQAGPTRQSCKSILQESLTKRFRISYWLFGGIYFLGVWLFS